MPTPVKKNQEKYNDLADRLADALVSQDPESLKLWRNSGDKTYQMTGPTFVKRHPELAKEYGITGKGQRLVLNSSSAPSLTPKKVSSVSGLQPKLSPIKKAKKPVEKKKESFWAFHNDGPHFSSKKELEAWGRKEDYYVDGQPPRVFEYQKNDKGLLRLKNDPGYGKAKYKMKRSIEKM
jgi:hypothetical protein